MNRYARWAFALAVLPVAACAGSPPPPAPMAPPAPPPLAAADAGFVTTAAQGGMAEIQEAQLALSMTKNPHVTMFANKMVSDHTANDDQLKQIAMSKNVALPADVSDVQMQQMNTLKGYNGHMFDREYLADQITDHQAMLAAFQAEATNGTDADLKKYASDSVPVIQSHLDMAKHMVGHAQKHMRMKTHHMASTSN